MKSIWLTLCWTRTIVLPSFSVYLSLSFSLHPLFPNEEKDVTDRDAYLRVTNPIGVNIIEIHATIERQFL